MVKRGQLRPVVGEAHVPELHAVVFGRFGMVCDLQCRCAHDLVDPPQRCAGQHHAAGGKHDFCQSGGNDGGEYGIECKVGNEPGKAAGGQRCRSQQQCCRHQENERAFREGKVHGLGHAAHAVRVLLRLFAVILDGVLERLKGIHRLLEHLHHRDAPDVLGARLAHDVLSRLVFSHEPGVLPAHHGEHGSNGNHSRHQARSAHAPVKHKHQYQHGDKHGDGTYNVGQIVRQQRFRFRRRPVQAVAQKTRGVGIKESQRRFHQVRHALFADIGCRAEGRQVSAHQRGKIHRDPGNGEDKCHPAVTGDFRRLRPIGGDGDQLPGDQPDADIGNHAQDHRDSREPQAQKGQALMTARIA